MSLTYQEDRAMPMIKERIINLVGGIAYMCSIWWLEIGCRMIQGECYRGSYELMLLQSFF